MKRVLKYLSFILLFVFSITLAACDDEQAPTPAPDSGTTDNSGDTNNSGENNSNNGTTETPHTHNFAEGCKYEADNAKYTTQHSKYCVDCKETVWFNHEYGEWKTTIPATLFVKGLQTKYCECGHKVTQEIGVTGTELVANEYTTNLMNSFEDKLSLTISNVDFKFTDGDFDVDLNIDDIPLYVNVDEGGNITAYLEGDFEFSLSGIVYDLNLKAAYEDDVVYILLDANNFSINEEYKYLDDSTKSFYTGTYTLKIPASDVYTNEIPMDEYMEEINAMIDAFKDEIDYISNNLNPDVLAVCVNLAINELMELAFVNTSLDGYCYELNYEGLLEFNEKLDTKTISELYEEYFGEDSFEALVASVSSIFDITIGDLNDLIKENDIDLKAAIEYIDELIKLEDEEASLKSYFEELTNEEIEDLIAYFSQTELKDTKVVDFISEYVTDMTGYKEMTLAMIYNFGDLTIYEIIDSLSEDETPDLLSDEEGPGSMTVKDMVDMAIQMLMVVDNCSFTTDESGTITKIDLDFNLPFYEMFGMNALIDTEIVFDFEATFDTEELITNVNATVDKIAIDENTTLVKDPYYDQSSFVYYDDEFIFDESGNVVGYRRITDRINGQYIDTINQNIIHDVEVERHTYYVDLSNAPISIVSNCVNIYNVNYMNNAYIDSVIKLYPNVVADLAEFNEHYEQDDLYSYFYGLLDGLTPSEELVEGFETNTLSYIYDGNTNTLEFTGHYGVEEVKHNFVKDEAKSVTGSECHDIVVDYYVCSDCGTCYAEVSGHEHIGEVSATYEDTNYCGNGCEARFYCSVCEESWDEVVYDCENTIHQHDLLFGIQCENNHYVVIEACSCLDVVENIYTNYDEYMTITEISNVEQRAVCPDCGVIIVIYMYEDYVEYYLYNGAIDSNNLIKSFRYSNVNQ